MKPIHGPGGKCLGYEQDNGSEIVLLAPGGVVLGKYLKAADMTVTAGGRLIGHGNLLLALLGNDN